MGPLWGEGETFFSLTHSRYSLGRGKFTLLTMSAERGSPDRPPARLTPRGLVAVAVCWLADGDFNRCYQLGG